MKRINKGDEPQALIKYRQQSTDVTWEQMKQASTEGQRISSECRDTAIKDQCGLCAFCEIDIKKNSPLKCRVEHFHPKADQSGEHNWNLDWNNMLAVCTGGSTRQSDPDFFLEPVIANLSCDAHKGRMIQKGILEQDCEGWILNPLTLPLKPCLFKIEKLTGEMIPDSDNCADCQFEGRNKFATLEELVLNTIKMLNLNCDRLCKQRLKVIWHIERLKKYQRQQGIPPRQGMMNIVIRLFKSHWPEFFTTIAVCLAPISWDYLKEQNYSG